MLFRSASIEEGCSSVRFIWFCFPMGHGNGRRKVCSAFSWDTGQTLLLGFGVGGVLTMRPPELVRSAIEHEYFERTLRGTFMEPQPLLQHLGLPSSTPNAVSC